MIYDIYLPIYIVLGYIYICSSQNMINNEFPLIKLPHKLRNVIKFMVSKTPMFGTALWLVNEGRGTLELLKKKKKDPAAPTFL